ncbi:hypothetical protein DFO68_11410 [Halomonas ventosae]|uniref:Uncharacterized protein n=1 Tax=Halomonas ventosae TaxID=229007 RepID=A0A4R6H8I3_9GAMM|nr:hypothetical protein DFO68_11410 [Halomonas ventosae]
MFAGRLPITTLYYFSEKGHPQGDPTAMAISLIHQQSSELERLRDVYLVMQRSTSEQADAVTPDGTYGIASRLRDLWPHGCARWTLPLASCVS